MSNYHREQDAINDEKIQSFKSEFPKYIGDFLDNMRELNNSSKTRLGYVYDLRTFFCFFRKRLFCRPIRCVYTVFG